MVMKKAVRIDLIKRDPVFFMDRNAGDVVDMSQNGVPKIHITEGDKTTTYVGYPFMVEQWEE